MAIHIIIDGYNLIRRSPALSALDRKDLQMGRDALVDMLADYKRIKAHKITVVFDGTAMPSIFGQRDTVKGIRILFSRDGRTADSVIKKMAEKEREQALVVSSDNAVVQFAASCGASVIASEEFEDKMAMAGYMALKGVREEGEDTGWKPTTKKKGPGKRLPKRKRKLRSRIKKL